MTFTERGQGRPLVLLPGIQGRWEWHAPTIEALAATRRVFTFSLDDVRTSAKAGAPVSTSTLFDAWDAHLDRIVDHALATDTSHRGAPRVTVVGISFGGLVAARYAARHAERVAALVLASSPSPRWKPERRQELPLRYPLLTLPLYLAGTVARLAPEIVAARPSWSGRLGVAAAYARRAVRYPAWPPTMASWVREWMARDLVADCRAVRAPTLVTTGEASLDRVVPVQSTLEYLDLIPVATHVTLAGTGHLGFMTRPQEFAGHVVDFLQAVDA